MLKSSLAILCLFAWVALLPAQSTEERKLAPFHKIVSGDKIIVQLVKADHESAEVKVQGIDVSKVKTEVKNGTLSLSVYGEPFTKKKVMVTVRFVNIDELIVNNGSEMSTSALFKADTLRTELKSGGTLYLDADIKYLVAKVSEGSVLTAEGYATVQDIYVASVATFSAFELEGDTVKVKAVTGGKAKINVQERLDAEATSNGYITYKGTPAKINRNATSGGSVKAFTE
jgi:translation initiation factor IF-1